MRRLIAGLALAIAIPVPGAADHVPRSVLVATPLQTFTPRSVMLVEGSHLSFANGDTIVHDVVSVDIDERGDPLFWAPLIGPGGVTDVAGVEGLEPGVYRFTCSIHGASYGELNVRSLDDAISN